MLYNKFKNKYVQYVHWLIFVVAFLIATPIIIGVRQVDQEVYAQSKICQPEDYSSGNLGDGKNRTPDQNQIQRAINECFSGEVRLRPGKTYESGTLELQNNVTFNLNSATILATPEEDKYWTSTRGNVALISAKTGTHDFKIIGLDRNSSIVERDENLKMGLEIIKFGAVDNVELKNFTVRSTINKSEKYPGFHILFYAGQINGTWKSSRYITIDGITVRGTRCNGCWGNDGIHVQNSKHVVIRNCDVYTSDDGIVVTTSRPDPKCCRVQQPDMSWQEAFCPEGEGCMFPGGISLEMKEELAMEDVLVENCLSSSISTALKFGTGTYTYVRDITFKDIVVYDSGGNWLGRGIGFQLHGGEDVRNVKFSNITFEEDASRWLGCGGPEGGGCRNVNTDGCYETCFEDNDLEKEPIYPIGNIEGITFENIRVKGSWANINFEKECKSYDGGYTVYNMICPTIKADCDQPNTLDNWDKVWTCCNSGQICGGPLPKGDLNNDGNVDVIDLGILLSNWGATAKPPSDLNQDGKVDVVDLGILLSNWG